MKYKSSSSSCSQASKKEHSHGSNCSCISVYTEEEVHYKITQKVSPGGNATIETIEVVNPDRLEVAPISHHLQTFEEKDIDEYTDLEVKQVKASGQKRKVQERYLVDNR